MAAHGCVRSTTCTAGWRADTEGEPDEPTVSPCRRGVRHPPRAVRAECPAEKGSWRRSSPAGGRLAAARLEPATGRRAADSGHLDGSPGLRGPGRPPVRSHRRARFRAAARHHRRRGCRKARLPYRRRHGVCGRSERRRPRRNLQNLRGTAHGGRFLADDGNAPDLLLPPGPQSPTARQRSHLARHREGRQHRHLGPADRHRRLPERPQPGRPDGLGGLDGRRQHPHPRRGRLRHGHGGQPRHPRTRRHGQQRLPARRAALHRARGQHHGCLLYTRDVYKRQPSPWTRGSAPRRRGTATPPTCSRTSSSARTRPVPRWADWRRSGRDRSTRWYPPPSPACGSPRGSTSTPGRWSSWPTARGAAARGPTPCRPRCSRAGASTRAATPRCSSRPTRRSAGITR